MPKSRLCRETENESHIRQVKAPRRAVSAGEARLEDKREFGFETNKLIIPALNRGVTSLEKSD